MALRNAGKKPDRYSSPPCWLSVAAAEVFPVNVGTDATPWRAARHLIEAEMDPAVDACIVDVVGNLGGLV